MTKEEAKAKLRRAESDLRMAEIILEMHENGVRELREDIEELEEIINKPNRWQDALVQPGENENDYFYISGHERNGLDVIISSLKTNRKPEHAFKTEEQAELIKEKILLMQEMHAFAHARNEGWVPDWNDGKVGKFGILYNAYDEFEVLGSFWCNYFVFGISVKSMEIAVEMFEEFGERIKEIYNIQY